MINYICKKDVTEVPECSVKPMGLLHLDEKNSEQMDTIRKFTLMDDTFMTQVFSGDPESTGELLRIVRIYR